MLRQVTSAILRSVAVIVTAVALPAIASAQTTAPAVFIKAPLSVVPTIDKNTRLDMVDYFRGGMSTASSTSLNGEARITAMDDRQVEFTTSDNGRMSIALFKSGQDSVVVVVKTTDIPVADSRVEVYSWPGWQFIDKSDSGVIADWVTPMGKKENRTEDVENVLGFMTASASFDSVTGTITFVPTVRGLVTESEYEKVSPYIYRELTAKVRGQKGIIPDKMR